MTSGEPTGSQRNLSFRTTAPGYALPLLLAPGRPVCLVSVPECPFLRSVCSTDLYGAKAHTSRLPTLRQCPFRLSPVGALPEPGPLLLRRNALVLGLSIQAPDVRRLFWGPRPLLRRLGANAPESDSPPRGWDQASRQPGSLAKWAARFATPGWYAISSLLFIVTIRVAMRATGTKSALTRRMIFGLEKTAAPARRWRRFNTGRRHHAGAS